MSDDESDVCSDESAVAVARTTDEATKSEGILIDSKKAPVATFCSFL
jgi:hypothetical protein